MSFSQQIGEFGEAPRSGAGLTSQTSGTWWRRGNAIIVNLDRGSTSGAGLLDEEWESEASGARPTLARGSTGSAVRDLQTALQRVGNSPGAIDGIFGSRTEGAVRVFQRSRNLAADGIVGPITWGELERALGGRAPRGGGGTTQPPAAGLDIVSVRGIQVARQISQQVEALLAAAEADGVRLSGGGFRSPDQQIALRKKHCGTSHYDIYDKPASQCVPPTARPGTSNHEKGLAIDFTYEGLGIKDQSNPGYLWLARNAARFGLKNLPSEPWHWSVDGK